MGYDSVIFVSDYFTQRVRGFSREKLEASFRATVIASLKAYGVAAGKRGKFPKHCFLRSGRVIAQALAGENLTSILTQALLKYPSTSWRYMCLMEVVVPEMNVPSIVKGVSEDDFRRVNDLPLSKLSRLVGRFVNVIVIVSSIFTCTSTSSLTTGCVWGSF